MHGILCLLSSIHRNEVAKRNKYVPCRPKLNTKSRFLAEQRNSFDGTQITGLWSKRRGSGTGRPIISSRPSVSIYTDGHDVMQGQHAKEAS